LYINYITLHLKLIFRSIPHTLTHLLNNELLFVAYIFDNIPSFNMYLFIKSYLFNFFFLLNLDILYLIFIFYYLLIIYILYSLEFRV